MRPFGPDPFTNPKLTPSSRAKRRTDGLACAKTWAVSSAAAVAAGPGTVAGAAAGGGAAPSADGVAEPAGAAACAGCGEDACGAAAAAVCRVRIKAPSATLSPTFTFTSFTTPPAGAGTSIVALSDSSVTSGSSFATVSPALTSTSITGTSVKSPISGTFTSMTAPAVFVEEAGAAAAVA